MQTVLDKTVSSVPSASRAVAQGAVSSKVPSSSTDILAENVRVLRARHRMSVSELARCARLSRQIIYKVEDGRANLRMDSLQRIADALGVEVVELLTH